MNQEILNNKPVFRKLISEYYREIAAALQEGGPTLEIGSGGGFFREYHHHAIVSDMLQVPGIDVVCDATQLPFREGSLKNIVMRGGAPPHIRSRPVLWGMPRRARRWRQGHH